MPNKKKKYNARFPPARIKKIMQKDEEVGKVAAAVPVIISRALELFVQSLIKKTSEITQTRNAKTLTTSHLKQCIQTESQFDFLKDLVACVPDVQGDDDSSNPPSGEVSKPVQQKLKKQRVRRPRKKSTLSESAGPSQTATEDSDEEDTDYGDDDDDTDDEEESRSEDSSLPSKPMHFNNQGTTKYGREGNVAPNGATSVIVSPTSFSSFAMNSVHIDEDYDS